jgi:hypothetical protein
MAQRARDDEGSWPARARARPTIWPPRIGTSKVLKVGRGVPAQVGGLRAAYLNNTTSRTESSLPQTNSAPLHHRCAALRLSSSSSPPKATGTMWSICGYRSSVIEASRSRGSPQIRQVHPSRSRTSLRFLTRSGTICAYEPSVHVQGRPGRERCRHHLPPAAGPWESDRRPDLGGCLPGNVGPAGLGSAAITGFPVPFIGTSSPTERRASAQPGDRVRTILLQLAGGACASQGRFAVGPGAAPGTSCRNDRCGRKARCPRLSQSCPCRWTAT